MDDCEMPIGNDNSSIDDSVGKSLKDHQTPPTDNEGTSKEIVANALSDVG